MSLQTVIFVPYKQFFEQMEYSVLPQWGVLSAGFAEVHSEWNYKDVCSPFVRLYLVTAGSGEIVFSDGGSIVLRPGYMYIVPAYRRHTNRCESMMRHYYVHVYEERGTSMGVTDGGLDFMGEIKADAFYEDVFRRIIQENPDIALTDADPRSYDNGSPLMAMMATSASRPLASRVMTMGLIATLMARWMACVPQTSTVKHPGVGSALTRIWGNPFEEFSMEELAAGAGMTADYFIRVFKAETGLTPKQYVTRLRMQVAQRRLVMEPVSIRDIAESTGYTDINYFTRVFRQVVGMSPGRYRRMTWK